MSREDIIKRIKYINEKLSFLKKTISEIELNKDNNKWNEYILWRALERDCESIIESAIRINQDILRTFFNELAQTYRESFELLEKMKVFSTFEIKELANTVGFRNRLAHEYMDLDNKIMLASAKKILKFYKIYLLKLNDFLEKNKF